MIEENEWITVPFVDKDGDVHFQKNVEWQISKARQKRGRQ